MAKSALGQKYGMLTIIEQVDSTHVLCKCDCGNTKTIYKGHVTSGRIDNCGCLKNARRQATCKSKYGITNVSQLKETKDKIAQTCQAKYGADTWFASEQGKEAVKQGTQAKHGVDHISKVEEVKQKKVATNTLRYGVANPMHSAEVIEKRRQSHKYKYGCDAPMQRDSVKRKAMRLRNGKLVWPSALPENRQKTIDTCLQRYGTSQLMDIPEKRKLAALNSAKANAMGISKVERQIRQWVESLNITTEHTAIDGTYIDIWVPHKRLAIEYHGSVWHSVDGPRLTNKRKQYLKTLHKNKQLSAEKNNYRLIQIWEPWWKYRQKQMKSYLKAALGVHTHKVGAREVILNRVSYREADDFFEEFHVLGGRTGLQDTVGLYSDGLLVACAAFSNGAHGDELTMSRWCVREDWIVMGGLSRVTKWASQTYKKDIYTIADLAMSDGHGYSVTGWEVVGTWYDYFYVHKKVPYCIPKRQRSKKMSKCPEGVTEYEWARIHAYMRIYDAGKRKYVYRWKNDY